MKRTKVSSDAPKLDMSSLVDVSFLLLIYFLVTSTLDPKESDLKMTVPTTEGKTTPVDIDSMQIDVKSDGSITLNHEILDSDTNNRECPLLLDRMITYRDSARLTDSKPLVVISAHDDAKGQRFVDVLNVLAHDDVAISDVTIVGFREE